MKEPEVSWIEASSSLDYEHDYEHEHEHENRSGMSRAEPKARTSASAVNPIEVVLLAFAAAYVAVVLYVIFSRIGYPFCLDWGEGFFLDYVCGLLEGRRLYGPPSVDFASLIHPPLFYWVSALASCVTGTGFFSLRLVSFAASLGTMLLIFDFVRRETGQKRWGFVAVGLYAATFPVSGTWFDIARPDALFVFLTLLALHLLRFMAFSHVKCALVAGLFVLAFFAKQPAAIVLAALSPLVVMGNAREMLRVGLLAGVAGLLGVLAMDYFHGGWYSYQVFFLPLQHGVEARHWIQFWTADLAKPLPFLLGIAAVFLLPELRKRTARGPFLLFALGGMLAASWGSRLHSASYLNELMPACCMLSIMTGVAMPALLAKAARFPTKRRMAAETLLYACCILQFCWLAYNPAPCIPTRQDEQAGWRFIALLRSLDGEVFAPCWGYYARMAGKRPHANIAAIMEIARGTDRPLKDALAADFMATFGNRRFSAVVMPYSLSMRALFFPLYGILDKSGYILLPESIFTDDDVFLPVVDIGLRPDRIYVPPGSPLKHVPVPANS